MGRASKIVGLIDRDLGYRKLLRTVKEQVRDARVQVGVLDEGKGAQVHDEGGALTTAEIAAINEFGTDKIPARPFVRPTFDREREALVQQAKGYLALILADKMTVERALGLMGLYLANRMKFTITGGAPIPPPNAPATIMRKMGKYAGAVSGKGLRGLGRALGQVGRAAAVRTLVDTGKMVGAISWSVVMGGKRDE